MLLSHVIKDYHPVLLVDSVDRFTLVPKPGRKVAMATGGGLALPEPLQDKNSCSWFKRFEVCAAANGWDAARMLLRLPIISKDTPGQCMTL